MIKRRKFPRKTIRESIRSGRRSRLLKESYNGIQVDYQNFKYLCVGSYVDDERYGSSLFKEGQTYGYDDVIDLMASAESTNGEAEINVDWAKDSATGNWEKSLFVDIVTSDTGEEEPAAPGEEIQVGRWIFQLIPDFEEDQILALGEAMLEESRR